MHDPLVVAFEIRRPWPRRSRSYDGKPGRRRWQIRLYHDHDGCDGANSDQNPFPWWRPSSYGPFWIIAGRGYYWPSMITVWHREPNGRNSGEVCKHYRRVITPDGTWGTRILHGWRWHVHHWHLQVIPLQELRRWLLTRCSWCGGKSRKGDRVNIGQWGGPRGRWWQGAPGLYHQDCSSIQHAHRPACLCEAPILTDDRWGMCARCGERRYGRTATQVVATRILASIPHGQRDPVRYEQACAVFARERATVDA